MIHELKIIKIWQSNTFLVSEHNWISGPPPYFGSLNCNYLFGRYCVNFFQLTSVSLGFSVKLFSVTIFVRSTANQNLNGESTSNYKMTEKKKTINPKLTVYIRCYQAAKMVIFYKSSYLYIFINRACVSMYVVVFILELHSSCKRCRRLHSPHWTTNHRWNIADWKLFHLDKGRCSLSKVVLNYLHPHKYGTSGSQPKNLVRYQP